MPSKSKKREEKPSTQLPSPHVISTSEFAKGVAQPVSSQELPKFSSGVFPPPTATSEEGTNNDHPFHSGGPHRLVETQHRETKRVVHVSSVFTSSQRTRRTTEEKIAEEEEETRLSTEREEIPSGEAPPPAHLLARYSNFSAASEEEAIVEEIPLDEGGRVAAAEGFSTPTPARKRPRWGLDAAEEKEKRGATEKSGKGKGKGRGSSAKSARVALRVEELLAKPALSLFPEIPPTPPSTSAARAPRTTASAPFFHHFLSMQPMRVRIGTVPLPFSPNSPSRAAVLSSSISPKGLPVVERVLNPKKFFQMPANTAVGGHAPSSLLDNIVDDDGEGVDVLGWAGIFAELPIYLEGTQPKGEKQAVKDDKGAWMGAGSVSVVLSTP